jgi:hypothetical protein
MASSRRQLIGLPSRKWLIAVGSVVSLSGVVIISMIALSRNSSRVETSPQTRGLQRTGEPTRTHSTTMLPSAMPEPAPGSLTQNAVITDRQFLSDDQLFGRGGRGIAVVVDNRNYVPVEVMVEGTLYVGNTVIQKISGGPYRMDPRQTILIPLEADPSLRPNHFGVRIVRVTPSMSPSSSP